MQTHDPLSRSERGLIVVLVVIVFLFGWIVLYRSAFLQHRHTDADVYFRAAWAVQSGASIYRIKDDNGWTYIYPPFLAILLTPFADPPADIPAAQRGYGLSYPVAIAFFYTINVAALLAAMHILASAIESQSSGPLCAPLRFGRQWWTLRMAPIMICAPMLGATLSRGQPTLLILLCLAATTAAFMHKRSYLAGGWLAAAICIKVFPACLLLYPMWRRDVRCLATCVAGLLLGLLILPAVVMGSARTIASYQEYYDLFLHPVFSGGDNLGGWNELHGHTQSFKAVLFRLANPDPTQRPTAIPGVFWAVHLALSAVVTIIWLLAAGWSRRRQAAWQSNAYAGLTSLLLMGVLIVGVLPIIPASRDHYFALGTILLVGLIAVAWTQHGPLRLSASWFALFSTVLALQIAVQIPRLGWVDDLGNVIWAELILWSAGIYQLWKLTRSTHYKLSGGAVTVAAR